MPPLSELQAQFAAALLDPAHKLPEGVTSHTSPEPFRRFNVYRNNVVASLIQTLEARYPVAKRLVGEEFFRAMARLYIDAEQPASPVLMEYGRGVPEFIEQFAPAGDMPYLADVARLEWLQHEAYHASDAEPIGPEALGQIRSDMLPAVCLRLHPSVRLLASRYPVLAIWRTNTHDAEVERINLAEGSDDLMILRPRLQVGIVRLPPGALRFIGALATSQGLAGAAQSALAAEPRFDFQHALAGLIESEAIIGYHLLADEGRAPSGG